MRSAKVGFKQCAGNCGRVVVPAGKWDPGGYCCKECKKKEFLEHSERCSAVQRQFLFLKVMGLAQGYEVVLPDASDPRSSSAA